MGKMFELVIINDNFSPFRMEIFCVQKSQFCFLNVLRTIHNICSKSAILIKSTKILRVNKIWYFKKQSQSHYSAKFRITTDHSEVDFGDRWIRRLALHHSSGFPHRQTIGH